MRSGDRGDDGEAKAEAIAIVVALVLEALERLKKAVDFVVRYGWPGVGYPEQRVTRASGSQDLDPPAGPVVAHGVVNQVGNEGAGQASVAYDWGRIQGWLQGELPGGRRCAGAVEGVTADGCQVEGFSVVEAALTAGQGEEGIDELRLFLAGVDHVVAGGFEGVQGERRVGQRDLQERLGEHDRGAQLVGGVGHEASLGVEGRFQAAEQSVDGVAEVFELVTGSLEGEAFVEGTIRDPPGGRGHGPDGSQDASGGEPSEADRDEGHEGEGDGGLDEELVEVGSLLRLQPAGRVAVDDPAAAVLRG